MRLTGISRVVKDNRCYDETCLGHFIWVFIWVSCVYWLGNYKMLSVPSEGGDKMNQVSKSQFLERLKLCYLSVDSGNAYCWYKISLFMIELLVRMLGNILMIVLIAD